MSDVELCTCGEPIAMCPHLGIFGSYEEKYEWYSKSVPELRAAQAKLAELARDATALRDRLRLAGAAHDAGEIAEDFGAELPYRKQLVDIADGVATFAPLVGFIPGLSKVPAAKTALEVMIEAARLLLRALTGK